MGGRRGAQWSTARTVRARGRAGGSGRTPMSGWGALGGGQALGPGTVANRLQAACCRVVRGSSPALLCSAHTGRGRRRGAARSVWLGSCVFVAKCFSASAHARTLTAGFWEWKGGVEDQVRDLLLCRATEKAKPREGCELDRHQGTEALPPLPAPPVPQAPALSGAVPATARVSLECTLEF